MENEKNYIKKFFDSLSKVLQSIFSGSTIKPSQNKVVPTKYVDFTGYVKTTEGNPVESVSIDICVVSTKTDDLQLSFLIN